jgi:hypothetical protein
MLTTKCGVLLCYIKASTMELRINTQGERCGAESSTREWVRIGRQGLVKLCQPKRDV